MIDIKNYEGLYKITEDGKVFSVRTNKFLYLNLKANGYVHVQLCVNGKEITKRVHRLVAEAFIPNIGNKPMVNHIDGIKHNNHYTNLEWVDGTENNLHAIEAGLVNLYDQWNVYKKGEFLGVYTGYKEITETFGIKKNTIANSIRYNRPTRSGFLIERSTTSRKT